MNKVAKGTIAAAAGVILLMGGAGSLAYWNDSANLGGNGQTISAGQLDITAVNGGAWTKGFYNNAGTQVVAPAAVANLSTVRVVPGNRLVYTQTFNLTASGDDLWFTITPTAGSVTAATGAAEDVALAAQINASALPDKFQVSAVSGGTVVASSTPGTYTVSSNAGTPSTITVTWTVDFPFGATAVNTAQLGDVNLSQGAITVTQVAAP